jgi:tetratricopeptide (TPR) repeat protein
LGPEGVTDPERTVRLAEAAVPGAAESGKADALITLGAALYRAGWCDEAIPRLEEANRARDEQAAGWAFLAMAHHRLGHRDEARRWLDKLKGHQPSTDRAWFWYELEVRLLRSEAEAVILYDPAFPDDPFAR